MTKSLKQYSVVFGMGVATLFMIVSLLVAHIAHANPPAFGSTATATTATTTALGYMTPGNGTTTTPVYDSYESDGTNEANRGNTFLPDSAVLALQINASSTLSLFSITFEYSNGTNCGVTPGGCDWYSDGMLGIATSSAVVSISTVRSFQWLFASSTTGGAGGGLFGINGTNNRSTRVLNAPTPMRYVRAVVSITGANGAVVEATFIPKKQSK